MHPPAAHRAIDAGFDAVSDIHRLMSFHVPTSDVSRLNAGAADAPIDVDPHTLHVVRRALEFSAASCGAFDITVAAKLVAWGWLPPPESRHRPDPRASWRDIELLGDERIRFHRPLWIDLGGIAKGYAVDHALRRMALSTEIQVCINAGGDLRISGPEATTVRLDVESSGGRAPVVRLQEGSLASSSGRNPSRPVAAARRARANPHVDGRRRNAVGQTRFVSVIAPDCVVADALTKVVLAQGRNSLPTLRRFGASALVHDRGGWRSLEGAR
jgi:thiamine biosynthesis lipoprotein